ncbi:uncharacterized protein [Panulirus ornatus]|uniref:uncharacterized protein n=1 Tax=Panulirus ornatus TaxID=150431 RepID=UPI003A87C9B0
MAATGLVALALHLLMALLNGVTGDLLQRVEVPLFAFVGGSVNVSCMYDLRATGLYSLKWYHNDTEFYRYVPTETHRPVDIKPTNKFHSHEISRTETLVTLSITSMTTAASGEYKCEVIAEHPSFRTETRSAFMTVLDEPLSPPMIVGAREVYESEDDIKLRCQPEKFPASGPTPSITWYLQGRPARREYVSPYRDEPYAEPAGATLHVPASQVPRVGGSVEAECLLKLGSFEVRSSRTLRVRVRPSSYLSSYFSAAGRMFHPQSGLTILSALMTLRWNI